MSLFWRMKRSKSNSNQKYVALLERKEENKGSVCDESLKYRN
jgi:hypothetical protein